MASRIEARFAGRLDAIDRHGLRRHLALPEGRSVTSNDYLALTRDDEVQKALRNAFEAGLPTGSTGSRLLSGHHEAVARLEATVARWQAADAALLYPSGFQANQGLLGTVLEPGDVVVSDALNHASLIDAMRLTKAERRIVPHNDVDAIVKAIDPERPTVVVVESVYSMDGDSAPLADLATACAERRAALIVDEAHATGMYGPEGAGRVAEVGVREAVLATVHPAGKALAAAGAFVVGSEALRDLQLQRARSFIYSTAPPPLLVATLEAVIERIRGDAPLRARPRQLGARLRSRLRPVVEAAGGTIPGDDSPIVPVVVGSVDAAEALAQGLRRRGWAARPIRPPTVPEGTCRVRLVVRADLTEADIDQLANDVAAALRTSPSSCGG
ncbi:MAG: 8-amino-7-oxononanoate synthase [Myxococcota bacterium]